MDKRVRENLLYVLEDNWSRFKRPVLWGLFALLLWFGISSVFNGIDKALGAVEITGYEPEAKLVGASVRPQPEYISTDSLLSIPSLGVETPLIFVDSTNPKDFYGPLKEGVTHYPSSLPGQSGTAIILGHSAPNAILRKQFNGVFSDIKDLEPGDEIIVQHEGKRYRYAVEGQEVLQRGQDVLAESLVTTQSKLVLLSCWPPGIDNKRLMIKATAI